MMKLRISVAAAGAALAVSAAGALLVPGVASAHTGTQTLTFTSEAGKIINYAGGVGAEQDTDVNSAGTIIGFDELNFTVIGTTLSADITFDLNGGFLYGTIQITPGHPGHRPGDRGHRQLRQRNRDDHRHGHRQQERSRHDHLPLDGKEGQRARCVPDRGVRSGTRRALTGNQ